MGRGAMDLHQEPAASRFSQSMLIRYGCFSSLPSAAAVSVPSASSHPMAPAADTSRRSHVQEYLVVPRA
jgi:hypothetical protein